MAAIGFFFNQRFYLSLKNDFISKVHGLQLGAWLELVTIRPTQFTSKTTTDILTQE